VQLRKKYLKENKRKNTKVLFILKQAVANTILKMHVYSTIGISRKYYCLCRYNSNLIRMEEFATIKDYFPEIEKRRMFLLYWCQNEWI